ncbi:MAG: TSUP family transporter, partial [Acidimicrobiales bacterium]
ASVYGAYFGAGLGVVFLGVLGLSMPDTLVRVNGLRSILSLTVNTVAALIFFVSAPVAWTAAGLMAGASLVGGYVGARVARRVPAPTLRVVVVLLGIVTSARLLGG